MTSPMLKILIVVLLSTMSLQAYGQTQEWCIADGQFPDEELQKGMDWACGIGGADCSETLVNHTCYHPNTLKDHASYAFNNYYQKFKRQGGTCDFKAAAYVTEQDPSHDNCKFEYIPWNEV